MIDTVSACIDLCVTTYSCVNRRILPRLLCIDRSQAAANTPGAVALPLDVAHAVSFLKPQGGTAFLGYLNDPATEGLPTLDTQLTIKALTKVARRILFYPIRLK
jgi:hypothetical protein